MTFSTLASPGVSLQGGGGSGGGGGGTPGGSNTQIQYNSSGTFAGASGLTTNGTELTIASGTKTADAPVLNMSQTWSNGAVTFTGLKFNAADTASAAASLLMDLQVGGTSRFNVTKSGGVTFVTGLTIQTTPGSGTWSFTPTAGSKQIQAFDGAILSLNPAGNNVGIGITAATQGLTVKSTYGIAWDNGSGTADTILTRRAAANLRLGAADAAAPVAQTLSVQSVVAGTTNTAGTNLTITGSQGTGTGAGGSIIFQVAPAGGTGSAQNALATALTINSASEVQVADRVRFGGLTWLKTGTNGNLEIGYSSTDTSARIGYAGVQLNNLAYIGFQSGLSFSGSPDTTLFRDAANTLALRNGTAAQRFNVYNTYTSSTNYEAFKIDWITTANTVLVGTEKGSGGGTARALEFQTDGTTRLTIGVTGTATFGSAVQFFGNEGFWTSGSVTLPGVSFQLRFSTNTAATSSSSTDIGLGRASAGVLKITNGSTGGGSLEVQEVTAPAAPAANGVRIYAVDNGSGKTQLMALFATGAAQQIAIEP